MFFVVVSAVWFGTSNAAREIVTERAIYLRERMVNLSIVNYIFSKYIILTLICIFQCTVLLGIVFFGLGFNGVFYQELGVIVAVSMSATALGLLLSTAVSSAEAAMSLTPIALIPQVVLGGLMVPMTTITEAPGLKYLMYIMPARWGFEGSIAYERLAIEKDPAWYINLHNPTLSSPSDYVSGGYFKCAIAQIGSESLQGAWAFINYEQHWLPIAVLLGMTVGMLALLMGILKRRDPV
jgi:ABC-type multidrug transport system permease subunit